MRGLADVRLVLREDRQQLELGVADGDQDDVEGDQADEGPMRERGRVSRPAARRRALLGSRGGGRLDADEDERVEKRRGDVDGEQDRERLRIVSPCNQTADEPTEPETEVEERSLEAPGSVTPACGDESGEECQLRRPEATTADADEQGCQEGLPRHLNEREEPVAEGEQGRVRPRAFAGARLCRRRSRRQVP